MARKQKNAEELILQDNQFQTALVKFTKHAFPRVYRRALAIAINDPECHQTLKVFNKKTGEVEEITLQPSFRDQISAGNLVKSLSLDKVVPDKKDIGEKKDKGTEDHAKSLQKIEREIRKEAEAKAAAAGKLRQFKKAVGSEEGDG